MNCSSCRIVSFVSCQLQLLSAARGVRFVGLLGRESHAELAVAV